MKTTTKSKPKELDLNLSEMRSALLTELLNSVRGVMQKFDDLESMERVLHSGTIAHLQTSAKPHSNGSSGGAVVEDQARSHHPDKYKKRRHPHRHTNYAEAHATVLHLLMEQKTPIATQEIRQYLYANGVLSPDFPQASGDTVVRKVMALAIAAGEVRMLPRRFSTDAYRYEAAAVAPATVPAEPKPGKVKGKRARPVGSHGGGAHRLGDGFSMRDEVLGALLSMKGRASPKEVTQFLLDKGLPAMRGSNPLNNHVNWAMRQLRENNKLSVRDVAGVPTYTLKRPALKITKSKT